MPMTESQVEDLTKLIDETRWFLRPGKHGPPPKLLQNLTMAQGRCLFTITSCENCSLNELSGLLNVRPSTASELVDRLVRADLVQRTTDEKDRRGVRLKLTRKGRNVHAKHRAMFYQQSQALLEKMTVKQRKELKQSLTVFTDIMRQIDGEPMP